MFLSLALAAGLFFVTQTGDAEAAMAAPALAAPNAGASSPVEQVRWRCGPAACWWTPGYVGVVPGYALTWGPPHRSHCYWRVNRRGNWKYRC